MKKKFRKELSKGFKTIGILGGLGPQATMDFEKQIHAISQKLIPHFENQGYPPMITYYLRHQPMILYEDGTKPVPINPHPHLLEAAKMLGKVADFIVIPSNTPHFFVKEIEQESGKKVPNMIEITIEEIKKRKLKRVGILAMGHSLTGDLYQKPLNEIAISTEVITDKLIGEKLDKELFKVMQGETSKEGERLATDLISYLRKKKVDAIIIACTELPFLLKDKANEPDLINPIEYLAYAAVEFAIDVANR